MPNEADAAAKKWVPQMRLTRDARDRLHAETRALVETRGTSGEAFKAIWATARREVHERHGLPTALRTIGATVPEDAASEPDADVADLVEVVPRGELPRLLMNFLSAVRYPTNGSAWILHARRLRLMSRWIRRSLLRSPMRWEDSLRNARMR